MLAHLQKSPDFLPAHPAPLAAFVAGVLLPTALKQRQVARVEIADEDVARLQALQNQRVVLTPNHPTNNDPALVFTLSRRAQIPFHYLCCREAFDGWNGWWGFFIQRLGAYSVVRGTIDRESFRYTRQVLAQPKSKLVIFPEGEVYSQNDSLLPFQVGAVQLALWGREEARKTEPEAQVLILPIALRYRFERRCDRRTIAETFAFGKELKLPREQSADLYARMRAVAVAVLSEVEREYSLPEAGDGANADLTPRFMAAKSAALNRAAQLLEVGDLPRGSTPEQMRVLLHRAEQELHAPPQESDAGSTPGASSEQRRARFQLAWRDLERLANWIAIYDGYAAQNPSLERIAEVIFRLENDVLGKATYAGNRIATVKVGEAFSLPEKNSRHEIADWTRQLETAVAQLL